MTYEYEQYLAHYGVKGQKWGQRQYQNEDGSYTEAGKERYWGGRGNRQPSTQQPSYAKPVRAVRPVQRQIENRETPEQAAARKEARKQKAKKILAISAGVTLAALGAYALGSIAKSNAKHQYEFLSDYYDKNPALSKKYKDLAKNMTRRKALFLDAQTRVNRLKGKMKERQEIRREMTRNWSKRIGLRF